jgi:hypothetical protein
MDVLKNRMGLNGLDSYDSEQEQVASCCVHGDENQVSINPLNTELNPICQ